MQAHIHTVGHLSPPERLRRYEAGIDVQPEAGIVENLNKQMEFLRLIAKGMVRQHGNPQTVHSPFLHGTEKKPDH